ncbi:MAG: hypothetical protein ACO3DW_05040 [Candidatus Limnocylindrus sp.]
METAFAILLASYLLLFGRAAAFFTKATFAAGFFAAGFFAAGFFAAGFALARVRPPVGASFPLSAGALSAERPVASSCDRKSAATSDGTDSLSMPADMLERLEPPRWDRATSSAIRDGPEPSARREAPDGWEEPRRSLRMYSGTPPGASPSSSASDIVSIGPSYPEPPTDAPLRGASK